MMNLEARDAQRDHIAGLVSQHWSYTELREFAVEQERDRRRAREIAEMFADLSGRGQIEEAMYRVHLWRLAESKATAAWYFETRGHIYSATQYAKLKADPAKYADRLRYKAKHKRARRALTSKGYARGERSGGAKLTEPTVRAILTDGRKGSEWARELGVSPGLITGIRKGARWRHVFDAVYAQAAE